MSRRASSALGPPDEACSTPFQIASTVSRSAVVASRSDFAERKGALSKSGEAKGVSREPAAMKGSLNSVSKMNTRAARCGLSHLSIIVPSSA